MISIDFAALHERTCSGADNPGKDNSDFEFWSPHDDGRHEAGAISRSINAVPSQYDGRPCFLGKKITYVRRKQDSECYNGEDFERKYSE